MPVKTLSHTYRNLHIACQMPNCNFVTFPQGIVRVTDADILLLTNFLDPNFSPSIPEENRLTELIGFDHSCPNHSRQNMGLIYDYCTRNLATLG